MSRPKILHCISTVRHGSAERQLCALSEELVERGWDVHVALCRSGDLVERLTQSGVSVHALGPAGHRNPMIISSLCRIATRVRPALIQTWRPQMDVAGGLAARLTELPWLLTERFDDPLHSVGWRSRVRKSVARHASGIISRTNGGDTYWQEHASKNTPRWIVPDDLPTAEFASQFADCYAEILQQRSRAIRKAA